MTRLGGKLPFQEAVEEVKMFCQTEISEATLRRTTHENGRASEAMAKQAVEEIEAEAPEPTERPERLVISTDGALIQLTTGEWREVKTVAIGEFAAEWNADKGELEVHSSQMSYFSRSYAIREFERYALGELHRRGLEGAKNVVAVNDGSQWIQSFIDFHCPKAVRIIDFSHAQGYLARMGKAILGQNTETFSSWYKNQSHQLKHQPPNKLLSHLAWFGQRAQTLEQEAEVQRTMHYLTQRREMIDYPHFRNRGYPIGSGSVESSHKHVVQKRLKGAGMRWAESHVDPLLSLRNLICNNRWEEGWQELVNFRQQQRWASRRRSKVKAVPPSITLDSVKVAPEPVTPLSSTGDKTQKRPWRPPADHPWRRSNFPLRSRRY